MIIYHPAYDLNHCAFRFITLLIDIEDHKIEWEKLQILDFYYVFPHLLANMRLPRNHVATKRTLKEISNPYEALPNPKRLMFELKTLQLEAAKALIAKGVLNKDLFLKGIVLLDSKKIPASLYEQIAINEKRNLIWYKLIVQVLAKYPLSGNDGLKDRTQLMEYRYDTN